MVANDNAHNLMHRAVLALASQPPQMLSSVVQSCNSAISS